MLIALILSILSILVRKDISRASSLFSLFRYRGMYIIADSSDNSVTLSRRLFDHMGGMSLESAKVFSFCIELSSPRGFFYAFTLNPSFGIDTQLSDIQYNSKYRTIGFEMLCPSVASIFYHYRISGTRAKLRVQPRTISSPLSSPSNPSSSTCSSSNVPCGQADGASSRSRPLSYPFNYYIILPPHS